MTHVSDGADPTFQVLVSSPALCTFRNAFESVTALPTVLAGRHEVDWGRGRLSTGICANLKNGHPDCAGCLQFPPENTAGVPLTYRCHFGLTRTAIPLRVNGAIVAYLWTGWVVHDAPEVRVAVDDDWEPVTNRTELVPAGPHDRVVDHERYTAIVDMLASFAATLHPLGEPALVTDEPVRSVAVARALQIIADEYHQTVSLRSIARRCNVSASYFSGLFRRSIGATLTDYVARYRVEKAKALLLSSPQRVSEIAYGCGFGSHSQFNRSFHRIAGMSPRTFRATHRSAA